MEAQLPAQKEFNPSILSDTLRSAADLTNALAHPLVSLSLLQGAGSISDGDLERRLGGLLRSLLDDEEADPADVESVQSAMAVVAGRARRAQPWGTSTEAHVVEENENEHEQERQHATKMS